MDFFHTMMFTLHKAQEPLGVEGYMHSLCGYVGKIAVKPRHEQVK